jgi:hypothetical protein
MFDIQYLHRNSNVPDNYKNCRLHIALEKADTKKDWDTFNKLIRLAPEYLKNHLNLTSGIFIYNYEKLSDNQKEQLFNCQ